MVGYGAIYVLSERTLNERYPLPQAALVVPTDAASQVQELGRAGRGAGQE
ncbi:MAG: hypothetical protein KGL25_00255 [Gammaproteobacteria bacterium]|nr:hypothetical protein [Gammaproteobacteria bacterium]